MNQKHLASVLLFAVIIAFSQGVLMLHKKRQAAQEAAEAAEIKLDTATRMHSSAQMVLTKTRESTAPLRKYYRMWLPEFEKTDSEVKAKNGFLQTLKRYPNLVVFDEVHTQANRELWDTMSLGSGARAAPRAGQ